MQIRTHTIRRLKILTSINLPQFCGLEYLTVNVPTFRIEGDSAPVNFPEFNVCKKVAEKLIQKRVPIRGKELRFFRKEALKLTLQQFGSALGASSVAVLKWEQNKKQRLHRINEAAVLLLIIEQLKMRFQVRFSDLCTNTETTPTPSLKVFITENRLPRGPFKLKP